MQRFLGSDRLTEAGPLELISDEEFDSDNEGRKGISLPGVRKGTTPLKLKLLNYVKFFNG